MPLIISLLSDQLIPNVLFIKQMSSETNQHVFISTDAMEKNDKSSILAATLGMTPENYQVIRVDPVKPELILQVLKQELSWCQEPCIINITGGTKMMSLMTYLHFSAIKQTTIYYWPAGAHYLVQLHPETQEVPLAPVFHLDLNTYLAAHGYSVRLQTDISLPHHRSADLFRKVVSTGGAELVPEIVAAKDDAYKQEDKQYLLGGWFEEWLFIFLKDNFQLEDNQIGFNLKLKSRHSTKESESDNEIDVAFLFRNQLVLWECKVVFSGRSLGSKITSAVYKISSLRQTLGLQAISFVVVLASKGYSTHRQQHIADICRTMQVKKVFSLEDLKDTTGFISLMKNLIEYGT